MAEAADHCEAPAYNPSGYYPNGAETYGSKARNIRSRKTDYGKTAAPKAGTIGTP